VLHTLLELIAAQAVTRPGVAVLVMLAAFVLTRVARFAVRRVIRQLANRSFISGPSSSPGSWRVRSQRVGGETGETGEQRRRQRIDAASRMISHLTSVVIWLVAVIVLFHVLDIEPAFFISSAGFLGAGLAIGGQHKVHDYLTGLAVHFEDRYGIGDEIVADVGWPEPVRGVVDHVGLVSTRLRDAQSTVHFANGQLVNVRNLSQEAPTLELNVRVADDADADDVARALKRLAGTDGLTDIVFVGDLDVSHAATGEVAVRAATTNGLDEHRRATLVERAERTLGS